MHGQTRDFVVVLLDDFAEAPGADAHRPEIAGRFPRRAPDGESLFDGPVACAARHASFNTLHQSTVRGHECTERDGWDRREQDSPAETTLNPQCD
jgi:hypothetical protein